MPQKAYAYLFILCTLLIQDIDAAYLKEDVGEPSKLLVRKKRVINRIPGEDVRSDILDFRYVAKIRRDTRLVCVGTILSPRTVISAARCFDRNEIPLYKVGAGSGLSNRGKMCNITGIQFHGNHPPRTQIFMTGIALVTVDPPLVFNVYIGSIDLHPGPILGGMHATIAGWGSHYYNGPVQTAHPKNLRSITVPIINHQQCVDSYRHVFSITEKDICTFHEDKQCGVADAGAPLVIDNLLVGVYMGVISRVIRNCYLQPDVFILVQHREYSQWIRANIIH